MPGKLNAFIKRFLPNSQVSKNAWVYGLGIYSGKLISLVVFPIVAVQLGMSATGQYDLTVSNVSILVPILSLRLGDAVYRWLKNADLQQKAIGVSGGLFLMLLLLLLSFPFYLYLHLFLEVPFLTVGYMILITQVLLDVLMQLLRGNGMVNQYMYSMVIRMVVFVVGELYAVFYTVNMLDNVLWAAVISNLVAVLWCATKGLRREYLSRTLIKATYLKEMLAYAAPLVVNALGWVLLMNANKLIIAEKLGHEQNGIFAVTQKLASPIFFLGVFYFYSAQDYFLDKSNLRSLKPEFLVLVKKVTLIMLAGATLLYVGSLLFLPLIFPELVPANEHLAWMLTGNVFMVSAIYFSIPYHYLKHSFSMALTTLVGILISVIICWLSVSSMGLIGAFLGIMIGSGVILLLRLAFSHRFFVPEPAP